MDKEDLQKNKRRFAYMSFTAILLIAIFGIVKGNIDIVLACVYVFAGFVASYMGLSTAADYFSKKGK